ncbi:MAG: 23S rRNA (adenine(2503)-C(2))-methyltransferase RlmN [Patescibacteria group bacterium]|nr:23S rRNA (adenine(2503)-C(2))-methyltransferase RlmN [Patescibacteria group bacterium]
MEIKALQIKLKQLETPSYRLKQALRSYYQDLLGGWEEISTWPKDLRDACAELSWSPLSLIDVLESKEPASAKFLFETKDKLRIESVVMRHKDGRNTVCISSQAGCSMGCTFCATGAQGLGRNLTAEEIVDQVIQTGRWLNGSSNLESRISNIDMSPERASSFESRALKGRVTNIVFMGMGEPFNNPDNVFSALRTLMDPDAFGLGARHISISTCGIIPGIQRLAKEAPQVNLAISLHAPEQGLRARIMPIAKAYQLDTLMHAIRDYLQRTNRKVMFEYVLLKNVNDKPENAEELADLLIDFRHLAHVNLIKYHATNSKYEPSNQETRRKFANLLKRRGIAVTERISFGEEIQAACGQLATQTPNIKKQDTNKNQFPKH